MMPITNLPDRHTLLDHAHVLSDHAHSLLTTAQRALPDLTDLTPHRRHPHVIRRRAISVGTICLVAVAAVAAWRHHRRATVQPGAKGFGTPSALDGAMPASTSEPSLV